MVREVGVRCILVGDMSPWCGSGYSRVLLRIRTLVTLVTWMVMPISTINLTTLAVLFDISLFIYIYGSPSLPRLLGFYWVGYVIWCCVYVYIIAEHSEYLGLIQFPRLVIYFSLGQPLASYCQAAAILSLAGQPPAWCCLADRFLPTATPISWAIDICATQRCSIGSRTWVVESLRISCLSFIVVNTTQG